MRRRVERDLPVRYAGASLDFNPIHLFDDAARAAGLDGVVLHGMCTLAWAAAAIEAAAGASLTSLSARFARPLRPGDEVTIDVQPAADGWTASVRCAGDDVLRNVRATTGPRALEAPPLGGAPFFYAVGREKIAELRAAVGAPGPPDVAPPTFAAVVARAAVFDALGAPVDGIVHAAQQLALSRPFRDGDGVETRAAIVDDRTRAGLRRLVVRAVSRVEGVAIAVSEWTLLRRL
jgi:acyl dehydratase